MASDWKKEGKATSEEESDLIKEMKRIIQKKQIRAEVVDKRPAGLKDPCTHCTSCPCMVIG